LDVVYAAIWLDVNVCHETIGVNYSSRIVGFIAYHLEIGDATTTLNITEERLY
jgi:hypothetical protein